MKRILVMMMMIFVIINPLAKGHFGVNGDGFTIDLFQGQDATAIILLSNFEHNLMKGELSISNFDCYKNCPSASLDNYIIELDRNESKKVTIEIKSYLQTKKGTYPFYIYFTPEGDFGNKSLVSGFTIVINQNYYFWLCGILIVFIFTIPCVYILIIIIKHKKPEPPRRLEQVGETDEASRHRG